MGKMAAKEGRWYGDGMGSPEISALALMLSFPVDPLIACLTYIIKDELFWSLGLRKCGYITEEPFKYDSHCSAPSECEAMDPSHVTDGSYRLTALLPFMHTPFGNSGSEF